ISLEIGDDTGPHDIGRAPTQETPALPEPEAEAARAAPLEEAPGKRSWTEESEHEDASDAPPPVQRSMPWRDLDVRAFASKPVPEGANQGKLLLTEKASGKKYLFKPRSGEAKLVGEHEGILAGERYRRTPAAALLAKEAGLTAPGA